MVEQIFSDGIGSIAVIGGTVRIDFMVFSPNEKEVNGQPKIVHVQRVVMTPEGFIRSAEKIQEAAQALSKLGTASRPAAEPRPVENAPSSAETAKPPHPVEIAPPTEAQPAAAAPPKRPFP